MLDKLTRSVKSWIRFRLALGRLQQIDSRMLADMGLERWQLRDAVRHGRSCRS